MNDFAKVSVLGATLGLVACGGSGSDSHSAGDISGSGDAIAVAVQGPISGFGSVIVNGVRYDTDDSDFEIDDDMGLESDLHVGQIVTIVGTDDGDGTGTATVVIFEPDLEGVVESIDLATSTIVVLGQTVLFNDDTVFEDVTPETIAVDDELEISGFYDADGNIVASYIEGRDVNTGDYEIKGELSDLDTALEIFSIGGLAVDYSDSSFDPDNLTLENGLYIEVEGRLNAGILVADEIELEDEFNLPDDFDDEVDVDIEGVIQSIESATSFVVAGVLVVFDDDTDFEGGEAADIVLNANVEVEGELQSDGSVLAEEIEFELDEIDDIEAYAPIDAIDAAASTITVLGITFTGDIQTLMLDNRDDEDGFNFDSLMVGDWVELDAADVEGTLVLTEISREEDGDLEEVHLQGFVDSFDEMADSILILGVSVDTATASFEADDESLTAEEFFGLVQVNDLVEVQGEFVGGVLNAESVELEDD